MFEDLGWENLELRKSMTRLNLLYKMSRGQIDIDVNSYLQPHSEVRNRGGHRYKYGQDMATKSIHFYSFFSRTIRLWNKLLAEIVESNFLAVFYSKLLAYLVKNHQALLFLNLIFTLIKVLSQFLYWFYSSIVYILYLFIIIVDVMSVQILQT